MTYEYDAKGNVRRVRSEFQHIATSTATVQDFWYGYDAMDRFEVVKGALVNGAIVVDTAGTALVHDAAGQRTTTTTAATREDYGYTADGYLATVRDVGPDVVHILSRTVARSSRPTTAHRAIPVT